MKNLEQMLNLTEHSSCKHRNSLTTVIHLPNRYHLIGIFFDNIAVWKPEDTGGLVNILRSILEEWIVLRFADQLVGI